MAYASGDTLVRAVMHAASGLPADDVINDFAFKLVGGGPVEADYLNLLSAVSSFYRDVTTSTGNAVGGYISSQIPRTVTHRVDMYDLSGGLPLGSPVFSSDWLGPDTVIGTEGCPTEVAGCLSFHADLTDIPEEAGATRPRARRRGRLFVGPLSTAAYNKTTPPYSLTTNFGTTLREAAVRLADAAAADDWLWSVWSRTDSVLRQIVGGFTDNAPDTQRRRGFKATSRTTFSI